MTVAVHNGFGRHILMLESDQLVPFTKVRLTRGFFTLFQPCRRRLVRLAYVPAVRSLTRLLESIANIVHSLCMFCIELFSPQN